VERSQVEVRPQAIKDLANIAVYLAEESGNDELAFRFLDAAEATFAKLAAMPEMGATRDFRDPRLDSVRMWRITGFDSHLVFYRPTDSGVEIIRVFHAKRDIESLLGDRR
jgi:toxin ParE1/3/4